MTVRHRCSTLFWGTIARIGHLMQPRDVRSLEKRCHNQARMIYSLYVALMEKEDELRKLRRPDIAAPAEEELAA